MNAERHAAFKRILRRYDGMLPARQIAECVNALRDGTDPDELNLALAQYVVLPDPETGEGAPADTARAL